MRLPFELDPEIIHHIIHSQAGSIGKAIIELIMNSMDAGAKTVHLEMTAQGFSCIDDGAGFASREDVIRYFGRFGTPHQEGDAKYGRFRLGRGQIMAHASVLWASNRWSMHVDTKVMGYGYDLEDLSEFKSGCDVRGTWYEEQSHVDLMCSVQEIRDLVKYTSIKVVLNGSVITRDPTTEKWDAEDEFAYYRAKDKGSVSIYNQGVLVRQDPGHVWGAGGVIVSKQAIALNVSRTEILRKTCPVWKAIAKTFAVECERIAGLLGGNRKTEERREQAARALLSGHEQSLVYFNSEEVITILPGNNHLSLSSFFNKCTHATSAKNSYSVVTSDRDIPKAESIARQRIVILVHPKTLDRFGCHTPEEFSQALDTIKSNFITLQSPNMGRYFRSMEIPARLDFATIRDAFVERTEVVPVKSLPRDIKTAWEPLTTVLQHYARLATGGTRYASKAVYGGGTMFNIVVGHSNTAQAWTDGATYIAINANIVEKLKTAPLQTAARIFALVDHEISHQGDSVGCGHDEAFWERYHDISIGLSDVRQEYLSIWIRRYTKKLASIGAKTSARAQVQRREQDDLDSARKNLGITSPESTFTVPEEPSPESADHLNAINLSLVKAGHCPAPPNLESLLSQARATAESQRAKERAKAEEDKALLDEMERMTLWAATQIASILDLPVETILPHMDFLPPVTGWDYCPDADVVRADWLQMQESNALHQKYLEDCHAYEEQDEAEYALILEQERLEAQGQGDIDDDEAEEFLADQGNAYLRVLLPTDLHNLIGPDDTEESLERNAKNAGFYRIADYLTWRRDC